MRHSRFHPVVWGLAAVIGALAVVAADAPDNRVDPMYGFVANGKRMLTEYLDQIGVPVESRPLLTYIPAGSVATSRCVDINGRNAQDDRSFNYCAANNTIYVGQHVLRDGQRQYGAAGPLSGIAHEYGHVLQAIAHVPLPGTPAEAIHSENQADCVSGAFMAFLHARGDVLAPLDIDGIESYLTATASADAPGRDHGTADERIDSFELGYRGALSACSRLFPATPLGLYR